MATHKGVLHHLDPQLFWFNHGRCSCSFSLAQCPPPSLMVLFAYARQQPQLLHRCVPDRKTSRCCRVTSCASTRNAIPDRLSRMYQWRFSNTFLDRASIEVYGSKIGYIRHRVFGGFDFCSLLCAFVPSVGVAMCLSLPAPLRTAIRQPRDASIRTYSTACPVFLLSLTSTQRSLSIETDVVVAPGGGGVKTTPQRTRFRDVKHARIWYTV